MEQAKTARPEAPAAAEGNLGDPDSPATGSSNPRACASYFAIDSKLRCCDLVGLRVHDIVQGSQVAARAIVVQKKSPHLSTRQYSQIVASWVASIGLDPAACGTHSIRCTKPTLIYRRTKNLRAIQLLLGHTKLENIVRYLGIEVDDALEVGAN